MTIPTIHLFESTSDARDASQHRDDIIDGDVLAVFSERVVGVLCGARPVAVSDARGVFELSELDGSYSASEREARDVLAEWAELDELVHDGDEPPELCDERGLDDHFPPFSRVVVQHAFSEREDSRGVVLGFVLGMHDFGSPESGPGPVERCELVRVRCDDGKTRSVYPGNLVHESEHA